MSVDSNAVVAHGWVEWLRVHVNDSLALDEECLVATPLNNASRLENFRPIFEFGGGGSEWTGIHTIQRYSVCPTATVL